MDSGCSFFPPLRYVFADVSNRKLATPYPSFLKDPAPWRLRPGPCAAPTLANFPRRFGAGRVGVAVGVPGTLSLRSALQVIPSTLFLAGQVSRKSFVVLPVPNTTELQLVRKGMERSSPRAGAAKVYTTSAHRPPRRVARLARTFCSFLCHEAPPAALAAPPRHFLS